MRKPILALAIIVVFISAGVHATEAVLPAAAAKKKSQTVIVSFTLTETGEATNPHIQSTDNKELNSYALELLKGAKLKPQLENGQAVVREVQLPFAFTTDENVGPWPADIVMPKAKFAIAPNYPFGLRRELVTGGAILELTIDKMGAVSECVVHRKSHQGFDEAAVIALKRTRFEPAKKAGVPVEIHCYVAVAFNIEGVTPVDWHWLMAPAPALPAVVVKAQPVKAN